MLSELNKELLCETAISSIAITPSQLFLLSDLKGIDKLKAEEYDIVKEENNRTDTKMTETLN